MIRAIVGAILSPATIMLLGAGVMASAVTQVTIGPMLEPQIVYIEVTQTPAPTTEPNAEPSPTATPEAPPTPVTIVVAPPPVPPTVQTEPPVAPPLPQPPPPSPPPPSPPLPCDAPGNGIEQGKHNGWEQQGRECPGPKGGIVIPLIPFRRRARG